MILFPLWSKSNRHPVDKHLVLLSTPLYMCLQSCRLGDKWYVWEVPGQTEMRLRIGVGSPHVDLDNRLLILYVFVYKLKNIRTGR